VDCPRAGDVLLDVAEVLRLAGRAGEAVPYVEQAIELYDRKEVTFPAAKARARLAELAAPTSSASGAGNAG
jgi:hypothetical protein